MSSRVHVCVIAATRTMEHDLASVALSIDEVTTLGAAYGGGVLVRYTLLFDELQRGQRSRSWY